MSTDEHKWEVKTVEERNPHLSLSFEQADKIWQYEQGKSGNSNFSLWEELDYELYVYGNILDSQQLAIYEKHRNRIIEINIASLTEQDKWGVNGIKNARDMLEFYGSLVPAFFNDPSSFSRGWLLDVDTKTKENFLCAEYQKFLFSQKKHIISNHFRHYRTYQPKTLDALLLRHKLSCVWPDCSGFIQEMDEPTEAVLKFLKDKVQYFMLQNEGFITDRLKEVRVFQEDNFKKYYPEISGWNIWERSFTSLEQYDQRVMLVLLLKFNGYDY